MSENKLPDGCPGKAVWNPYNKGHELLQSEEYAASSPQDDDVVVEIHPVGTRASLNGGGWQPMSTAPRDGTEIVVEYSHLKNGPLHHEVLRWYKLDSGGWWTDTHSGYRWSPDSRTMKNARWSRLAAPTNEAPRGEDA